MEAVVLEQLVDPPIEVSQIAEMEKRAAWCLHQYRVRHVVSLLSLDGRRLACAFEAPDAESLRSVLRQLGQSAEAVWAATVHAPTGSPPARFLSALRPPVVVVERRFVDPADFAAVQATAQRAAWCLDQHRVQFLRTYFSKDRRRMICLYSAPDAESVRSAQRRAGMPVEKIWAAAVYEPGRE